jgi:SAM-dependent methyltransferase
MEPWQVELSPEELKGHDIWQFRRHFLEKQFPAVAGMKVLEMGSGPAHDSLVFAERGASVTALDQSAAGLECAKRIYGQLGLPVTTLQGDARNTGLPEGGFDIVFNAGVLEHFKDEDLQGVIDEMIRLAKPGGWVLAFCPNRHYFYYQHHLRRANRHAYEFERAFTASEMRARFVARGLDQVKLSGVHVHPAVNYLLPRWLPKHHRIEPLSRRCFRWLENMGGCDRLKSLIGQDFVVWSARPERLGHRIPLATFKGGNPIRSPDKGSGGD